MLHRKKLLVMAILQASTLRAAPLFNANTANENKNGPEHAGATFITLRASKPQISQDMFSSLNADVMQIDGKVSNNVALLGRENELQRQNAAIFPTDNRMSNQPLAATDNINQRIKQRAKEIATSLQPFGADDAQVNSSSVVEDEKLIMTNNILLGEPIKPVETVISADKLELNQTSAIPNVQKVTAKPAINTYDSRPEERETVSQSFDSFVSVNNSFGAPAISQTDKNANASIDAPVVQTIVINGLANSLQRQNARNALTLQNSLHQPMPQSEHLDDLIEQGEQEIINSQHEFGFADAKVTSHKVFDNDGISVIYDVELNAAAQQPLNEPYANVKSADNRSFATATAHTINQQPISLAGAQLVEADAPQGLSPTTENYLDEMSSINIGVVNQDDDALSTRQVIKRDIVQLQGKTIDEIVINGLEDDLQRQNALIFLTLNDYVGKPIEQADYINYLIKHGKEEIATSQQPFGYYNVEVDSSRQYKDGKVVITYDVRLNEPTVLKEVTVRLAGEANQDEAYVALIEDVPLRVGEVLNHEEYEDYKQQFIALSTKRGYFSGHFSESAIYVEPEEKKAEVALDYDSGNRYIYRSVTFNDVPLDDDLLARFVRFERGDPYLASDISKLQQDLQGSGYFKQTFVGSDPDTEAEAVDVTAQLAMNKPKRYALGIGYSTDSGVRGKFDFDHRYVNRRGHSFSSRLYASEKDSHWDNIYRIPAQNPTTDYYFFRFGGKVKKDTYDQTSAYIEGGYNFRLGKWEHRYSANALYEDFTIGVDSDEVMLYYPRALWTYTSTTNRLNPESGFQARFELLGASEDLLSDVSFAQANADFRFIQKLNDKHRVTLRSDLGATWTDNFHSLPSSLRYYAGGDRSIRGYAYESIGDRDRNGDNLGGRYIATASVEYEYFVKPDWAAAIFVDGGDAFIDDFEPVFGAGVGVHWRSPVGPIKLDVGHGFDDDYGDDYRLHISVGAELDL